MLQKNEIVTVTIEDMGIEGEGIGKVDGYTLFIKDAIVGDVIAAKVIKTKKNYGYARIHQILTSSPYRVEPRCSFHRQCGGCQIQALNYEKQLEFKQNKVRNNLIRIGKFKEELIDRVMEPIVGMEDPYHYRNKAQFPIGTNKNGEIITGFYAGRTHSIIANTDCCIGNIQNEDILKTVLTYMQENKVKAYDEETRKGLVRHILIRIGHVTNEIMVCVVINGNKLPASEKLVAALCKNPHMTSISISSNKENTNVIMGKEIKTLWGRDTITDSIGGISFQISPLSFYQVNSIQTEKLYQLALSYADLKGKETVWDLYCGIGTISLFLSQQAKKVYGVEIVPEAIEDARSNAKINQIENVEFFVGKAEEVLPKKYREEGIYADVIVVDPPRKGCDELCLKTMLQMKPKKIVYVSCDSATLARDLEILCKDYQLEKVRAVDQFGHTVHVESVIKLQRKDT